MKTTRIRCFWLFSALVAILTTIPYVLGFASQGSDWVYTGFVFGVEDGNSYIAKMLLGATGDWLFRTPYTAEAQRGVLAFLPYILLGKIAGGAEMHLQLVLLYHLFRIAAIPFGIWATYRFADYFLSDERWSSWATVIATLGSGAGWVLFLVSDGSFGGSMPLGFISPETFGFLAYYGLPHLIVARALLLLGLRWYLESDGAPKGGWKAGGALVLIGLVQPLTVATAYAVILAHQVFYFMRYRSQALQDWRSQWLPSLVRVMALSLPVFLYNLLMFSTDPFLKLWTDQNLILSPHPVHYIIAYGLLLPFVVTGMIKAWRDQSGPWLLPIGWAIVIPILAYAPYNLQRRLPEGSWVALVLLAAYGLARLSIANRLKEVMRVTIVILSLITPILLIYGGTQVASTPGFPAFRPRSEIDAFQWLSVNIKKDEVVLASYETGNGLPAWAPVRVVIGHGPESANLSTLRPQVRAYYAGDLSDVERRSFLNDQRVSYVFYGPEESRLGALDKPSGVELSRIYAERGYAIYQVQDMP